MISPTKPELDSNSEKTLVAPMPVRRSRRVPVRFLLPNIITLLAICSGVTAIRLGFENRFELAVAAVIFACLLDALDGRIARLLKGTSKFGAELDSLADFVNFGVAPGVLLYMWSLQHLGNLGWIAAMALPIGCALRLARFNVMLDEPDRPAWTANYFIGAPAPAGAFLAMAPMYLGFLGVIELAPAAAWAIAPWVFLVAIAMISPLPTYSGKGFTPNIRPQWVVPVITVSVLLLVMLIAYPWQVLLGLVLLYVTLIPFSVRSHRSLSARLLKTGENDHP